MEKTKKWNIKFEIYKQLDVHFDEWFESEVEKPGKQWLPLLKQGIAKRGEGGAVIIDLSKFNLDILILKSDGSSLYATKDLALADLNKKFRIDKSIYVIDNRQRHYLCNYLKPWS